MKYSLLNDACLLEVTEPASAHKGAKSAAAQRDTCPSLVFDKGE
jgi:hypothetical protein